MLSGWTLENWPNPIHVAKYLEQKQYVCKVDEDINLRIFYLYYFWYFKFMQIYNHSAVIAMAMYFTIFHMT